MNNNSNIDTYKSSKAYQYLLERELTIVTKERDALQTAVNTFCEAHPNWKALPKVAALFELEKPF